MGANGVVMAEPLAGMLSLMLADEFSRPCVKCIVDLAGQINMGTPAPRPVGEHRGVLRGGR